MSSFRIPFYGYVRLLFLLYLILPQTQGARAIYEEKIHPFLQENEGHIDEFIASAHDRLKATGITYNKQAIEYVRTNILGLPASEQHQTPAPDPAAAGAQGYTQSLLARFSVPAARWTGSANAGTDFYSLLAGAVSAASTVTAGTRGTATQPGGAESLIPSNLKSSGEKMSFITAQRERLNILLSALETEAQTLQNQPPQTSARSTSINIDGHGGDEDEPTQRPPSGLSMWSALSKSRSEVDFEKIDAESGAEDENAALRRRNVSTGSNGGWMPWNWSSGTPTGGPPGTSSGVDQ